MVRTTNFLRHGGNVDEVSFDDDIQTENINWNSLLITCVALRRGPMKCKSNNLSHSNSMQFETKHVCNEGSFHLIH